MELTSGDTKVEFDYIGEGMSGDYDPDDPNDSPLLRFYVSKIDYSTKEWEVVDGGSYCTYVDADTEIPTLAKLLGIILQEVTASNFDKRRMAELSHMREEWAE